MTTLTVTPMTQPLGAEISGIDLGKANGETIDRLQDLLSQHLVLLFRDQTLSDEQLVTVSGLFGKLDVPAPNPFGEPFHKGHPEINVISNIVSDGKPAGNLGAGEAVWHADMTYQETPPRAAILYALQVPDAGGNTYFADMYQAYEALPDDLKSEVEGKLAIHDASHNSAGIKRKGYAEITDVRETPGARHPLVRIDPTTGRKALFLGRRPRSYIPGLSVADSDRLLDRLWAHIDNPNFYICHEWRVGDALMWSNQEVLHRRDSFDADAKRLMHRTQIRHFHSDKAKSSAA